MKSTFENKAIIGGGIYTMPDIAQIFRLPYHKVSRWIKEYWDNRLAKDFEGNYSWTDGKARAISFHTLIELYVFMELSNAGVKAKAILQSHKELSKLYKTKFPFATNRILSDISTDGKKIYFKFNGEELCLDGKKQFNLGFIQDFFKKIDFGNDELASRLWPLGREYSVVVDPEHHFGQPVLDGTNIVPDTIYTMYKAGDNEKFIAMIYGLTKKEVTDALKYCKKAA